MLICDHMRTCEPAVRLQRMHCTTLAVHNYFGEIICFNAGNCWKAAHIYVVGARFTSIYVCRAAMSRERGHDLSPHSLRIQSLPLSTKVLVDVPAGRVDQGVVSRSGDAIVYKRTFII